MRPNLSPNPVMAPDVPFNSSETTSKVRSDFHPLNRIVGHGSCDIAIIGFSLLFPKADSTESFWDILVSGKCVASEFPPDRLRNARHYENGNSRVGPVITLVQVRPNKASFLERDISAFDTRFFSMTSEEAAATDPQQRILLETTYHALENAGIPMEIISGSDTSVYTGCFTADYTLNSAKDPDTLPKYAATGLAGSMLSNRISTFFGLTGPSLTVDTACSSSLVALDLACQSIVDGRSKMAIVAGCNLLLTPDLFISLSSLGFLSPDGVCHSFDARANGYGRGEGFGTLIIKGLNAAVRDGDTIRAVIRAIGTNQNGHTNLAQPNKEMQTQLIQDTYRKADLDMSQTRFFEAHGTGTAAGDPLEASAIGDAFRPRRDSSNPLIVGALKANIGHLEGAAGVAGVIKTILVLETGIIPPIADLNELNENIDTEFLNLKFPKSPIPWPCAGLRRASVNSFGFGGTNAHVVLDDALHYLEARGLAGRHCTSRQLSREPTSSPSPTLNGNGTYTNDVARGRPLLFVWSATDQKATVRMLEAYQKYLEKEVSNNEISQDHLRYLAYTLSQRRSLHSWRAFAIADSALHLIDQLMITKTPILSTPNPKAAFVFTGQGAQWVGMGKELFSYPVFRDSILEADRFLETIGCSWKASDLLMDSYESQGKIHEPRFAQPLCTILQVAVVELLRSFNIHPVVSIGHSSGEIAAAFTTGAICSQSAWKLAYFRGLLSSELVESPSVSVSHGAMMAVGISESALRPYLDETLASTQGVLSIACFNSPQNITLAGDEALIEAVRAPLDKDGIFTRILKVPVAYHSSHMTTIASTYEKLIGTLSEGKMPSHRVNVISSVTGDVVSAKELRRPQYWVQNMVSPVRFADAMERLYRNSVRRTTKKIDLSHRNYIKISDIVEVGPHCALQGSIREIAKSTTLSKSQISYTPTLVRGRLADITLLELIGNLHCRGFGVNLQLVNGPYDALKGSIRMFKTLPEYPYDHSQLYWSEPRIAKNIRLPSNPYNEFLGLPVADWNPSEPRWRNTLKTSSITWLEDHKINGEILFPAAGMLVMAIEGITQVLKGRTIKGYELKDVHFRSALPITTDDSGVDVQFHLKLLPDVSEKLSSWASFSLYVCNDQFTEVCRGSIKAMFSTNDPLDDGDDKSQIKYIHELIESINSSYETEICSTDFYTAFRKNGYQYGHLFQGVQRSAWNNCDQGVATVSLQSPMVDSPSKRFSVFHPCTLDNILQLVVAGGIQGRTNDMAATWVPTYLTKMWISSSGFKSMAQRDAMEVCMTRQTMSSRLKSSNLSAISGDRSRWLIEAEGIETTLITGNTQVNHRETGGSVARKLCYELIYRPDVDLAGPGLTIQYVRDTAGCEPRTTEFLRKLRLFMFTSIFRTVNGMSNSTIPATKPHLQKQFAWMQRQVSSAKGQLLSDIQPDWAEYTTDSSFKCLKSYLKAHGGLGEIFVNLDDHITHILQGTVDISQVFDRDNMIEEYYRLVSGDRKLNYPLSRYIDALAHKNPDMRILQTGSGIVPITKSLVQTLTSQTSNGPFCRFSHYDVTDSSESKIGVISREVGVLPKTQVRLLNVEDEPTQQGYENNSYDLVIAVTDLRTVECLRLSLKNLRRLLRDGGKLLIVDFTNPNSMIGHSTLGYLSEWWQNENLWEDSNPSLEDTRWSQVLKSSGFSGLDVVFPDFESEKDSLSTILVSSPTEPSLESKNLEHAKDKAVLIIHGFTASSKSPMTQLVSSKLRDIGFTEISEGSFHDAATLYNLESKLIVVVQDQQWLSLGNLDAEEYALFHTTVSRYKHIMWLSEIIPSLGVSPIDSIQGLARTLRMENHGHIFATVGIDTSHTAVLETHIEGSLRNFLRGVNTGLYEPELAQIGELLHIPRVYECDSLNQMVYELSSKSVERPQRFGERNMKLKVRQPGLLDTLYFEEVPDSGPLASDEIEVEVKAIGVNFKDCLVALGRVPEDRIGCECSGLVLRAGSECRFQPGDRVLVSALDTFRGRVRCQEMLAMEIPKGMTFADAGALSTNFITAYHSLVVVARLKAGESVLIHSGAGGTGQAAIQIAKICGAQVFTTVGSQKKKDLLSSLYDIPMENILNSRDLSFAAGIKRLTQNRGVDVVLNSLAGDALIASWECVASFGRFIEIGKKDIFSHNKLSMFQFARNTSFSAVDIAAMILEKPELVRDALVAICDLFNSNALHLPSPMKSFPVSQVESAFRHLQSGTNLGKVVVEVDPNDTVLAAIKEIPSWKFNPDETFVIAGGLGGQGRSISRWMVSKGAKNLVLLSRTGPKSSHSVSFIQSLEKKGTNVYAPQCDIADVTSLGSTLDYCRRHMPPIKGCIQAAMNIKDSMFENMSYESWTASLKPKVQGSWNLHEQLPRDLDFFIMFSSISGIIGSQGQANYAVGNTFQDGLAKYRLSQGEKATSLDLGILANDGYVAENQEVLLRFLKIKQMLPMTEAEVLFLLEHFCDKSLPFDPNRSQVVLGLGLPANIMSQGMEPANWTYEPMFANLHQMTTTIIASDNLGAPTNTGSDLIEQVANSKSLSEAADILANSLATKLSAIFSMPQEGFDPNQPLHTYGVDSLIAVELRNWFIKNLKVDLAIFEILGGATATTLGRVTAEKMRTWP
ncbi:putative polyketide synthase [Hypoxylon sp. NC0597]|nr:putative polyketide synthase [Hypoxylon sp. NC0597]